MMDGLKAIITDDDVDQDFNYKLMLACRRLPYREISTVRFHFFYSFIEVVEHY